MVASPGNGLLERDRYFREELKELARHLRRLVEEYSTVYCLFNNETMFQNARELQDRLAE